MLDRASLLEIIGFLLPANPPRGGRHTLAATLGDPFSLKMNLDGAGLSEQAPVRAFVPAW
jgi:hypothetical protein